MTNFSKLDLDLAFSGLSQAGAKKEQKICRYMNLVQKVLRPINLNKA